MVISRSLTTKVGFAELHCLSNYSFLSGASHPEELVEAAAQKGYRAIALTDECTYSGLVKAHMAAKKHAIKFIVGSEFRVSFGTSIHEKLVLLAPNRSAYGQLAAFISKLRMKSEKGSYSAQIDDFRIGLNQCFVLWVPSLSSISILTQRGEQLKSMFPEFWIALELFRDGHDLDKTAHALTLSMHLNTEIVASNDVRMHNRSRQPLKDLLKAIRKKTTVTKLEKGISQNSERTFRDIDELMTLYPIEAIQESVNIASRCSFSMDELSYEYPKDLVPPHLSPTEYLKQLTMAGAKKRWPRGTPAETQKLIDKELRLIHELEYEYYFLTIQDIVQFAREQDILCQGRGSAANSAVCYCLHITEVDPSRMHLLFERFVSKERNEPPDIDVDFEHERREEVIQYIYKRYGRDRAALAASLVTYRPKSAIRDVGKALGINLTSLDTLTKSLAWWDKQEDFPTCAKRAGLDPNATVTKQLLFFVNQVLGFPRHLSQHVGGFVISEGPLAQLVPVENASMPERTVIQWDKEDLEALGLLKIDVLALGMLTAIRKSLSLINDYRSTKLTVQDIPPEDSSTYHMLQRGDSVGVFQVESRAQMAMLPRLKPQNFYDLVIEVAIVRPGPIQGDMVHPYLRRRQGLEPVEYPNEDIKRVLERTLGIPIFQEQVIELAMVAAGFNAGEADQLRRAMAAWKRRGGLGKFEKKLINGMTQLGHDREFATRVFNQIKGFGEYGFPESHAASFALLVYVSAWLKRHEPSAFYCGLLNSLPMGFYSHSQLIQDAQRHHIVICPIDVQHSHWDHRLESSTDKSKNQPAIRLGMRLIKGLDRNSGVRIEQEMIKKKFTCIDDLAERARVNDQNMRFLARSGALRSLSGNRHQAHWDVAGINRPLPLEEFSPSVEKEKIPAKNSVLLSEPSAEKNLVSDYRYTGFTLGPHPMNLIKGRGDWSKYTTARKLVDARSGQFIRVAGLVTGRQRPSTASGVIFMTIEDETGNMNVVIWTGILKKFRSAVLQGQLLKIKGVVEREGRVIHVVAGHIEDASHLFTNITSQNIDLKSRDFH